jgi:hypothetical protein
MFLSKRLVSRSLRSRLLGCSVVALAAAAGGTAYADCAPNPPVPSSPTTCSGATVGGLTVSTYSTVTVATGASLTAGMGDAAAFTATSPGASFYTNAVGLNVNGRIEGAGASGVIASSGGSYGFPATQLNITVGGAGAIEGATAVQVLATPSNTYGRVLVSLDNTGAVQSSSGAALVAANSSLTGFSSVTNRLGGYIGGINGVVQTLTNAGTIDGGAGSAYSYAATNNFGVFPSTLVNSGVMRSNGAAATLDLPAGQTITNSGAIANAGSGAAINAGQVLGVTNTTGGVISTAGPIAINADGLTLTNFGTITGSVVTSGLYGSASTIDSTGGLIQGDLLLGSRDDLLISKWDLTAGLLTGVSGRIDGGGGVNTLQIGFSQNSTLDPVLNQVVLPSNFQRLNLQLSQDAILTLNGDAVDGLRIGGAGTFITTGTVTSQGTAFKIGFPFGADINFSNTGDITANFPPPASDPYALTALDLHAIGFSNTGTITANGGDGVTATLNYASTFHNAGTITATGTAANLTFGTLDNTGLIRSTQGVAVKTFSGAVNNSGKIEGGTTGVSTNDRLTNTGSVTAANGIGVDPGMYGIVDNQAGGVITAARSVGWETYGGGHVHVLNAGVLNGDVYLKSIQDYADNYSTNSYADRGGTLNGSLTFGIGSDTVVTDLSRFNDGRFTGITGTVDAGGGTGLDTLLLRLNEDATRTLALPTSFETFAFDLSDDAEVKLTFSQPLTNTLSVTGQGKLDLTADISTSNTYLISFYGPSAASAELGGYTPAEGSLSLISRGALTVNQTTPYNAADGIILSEQSSFENAGSLTINGYAGGYSTPVGIRGSGEVINSGVITLSNAVGVSDTFQLFTNTGTLIQATGGGRSVGVRNVSGVENSGTIQTEGLAIGLYTFSNVPVTVDNSGRITSTSDNAIQTDYAALALTNTASGVISSPTGYAIRSGYGDDKINNAAAITGRIDLGSGADTLENHGAITGDIAQGYGDGFIDNYGVITGNVSLGDGNDTFIQRVGASVTGIVDGGYGLDTLAFDSTNGGSVSASQFKNFESFSQIGGGSVTYSGAFSGGPIRIDGGGAVVLAGTSVSAPGNVTFSGGAKSEQITIEGAISGGLSLGAGVDTVINRGAIGGAVVMGAGDDIYTEGPGATVNGAIEGGAGTDTYIAELNGDRAALHARTGFENLGVTGSGALSLQLDQNWSAISLQGANLYLTAGAFTVGRVSGGDAAEAVRLDVDVAQVNLGGGDDDLTLAGDLFAGNVAGGAGADILRFTDAAPVTLGGVVNGFETIAVAGGRLAVAGTLGATGETASLGDGDQTLSVLSTGVLDGTVDLGAGSDTFRMAAGGQLVGTVLGGAGDDLAAIDLTSDLSLRGDQLQQFETLQVTGSGALSFTGGAAKFDRLVTSSRDLTIAAGSALSAGALGLDGANNVMTIAGTFTGQVDLGGGDDVLRLTTGGIFNGSANGGAGSDRLELALGGTDPAPTALGATPFTGFETLSLQSGVVSLSGDYGFDLIQIDQGRLIGLAGSRLSATRIMVGQGATFGSAGAVAGDILVAGTLSPGASPGTMTVTGNVALAAGSTALFELSPTVSDKLVVSGKVTIAQDSTLRVVGAAGLTPGRTLDLIVADGGITGAFSTIDRAQGQNLYIRQSATRLQALGLFTTDTTFSSQVSGAITTLNNALIGDRVGASLVAALPALVDTTTGKSDAKAFARLTPQAYASASQLATEDGLSVIDAAREQSRFVPEARGLFGFGQAITGRRTLDGDAALGVASGKLTSRGGLSGVAYGARSAWIGAFVGYLDGHQHIGDLDARTSTNSFLVGAIGQARLGKLELGVTAVHDGADADTRRVAPGGPLATSDYKIKSWVADVSLAYRFKLNADWAVRPRLGASYIRTTRDGLAEQGGGAFALAVDADKSGDWFVDGQVEVLAGQAAGARLHPYASVGFRTRTSGDSALASGVLSGMSDPLTATGLDRDGTLASVGAGLGYDLSHGLTVSATYSGEFGDGGRQGALLGLRWTF